MTRNGLLLTMLVLAGCGADTIGSAAVGAATKAEEVRQARQLKGEILDRVDAAQQAEQQHLKEEEAVAAGERPKPQP